MHHHELEIQPSIINLVEDIINHAIHEKASDIHLEPYVDQLRIRFRIDGLLREYQTLTSQWMLQIISRIKVLASLDISEKRLPQDGHFNWPFNQKNIDCRISTCPTIFGEKIVIRLLDSSQEQFNIAELGMSDAHQTIFLNAIAQPQGLILVTGPTGSGKTVTLYSAINHLNNIERNISTIEDPVEIKLHGINQVSVNPKIGLTFSHALRAFLRQDPDVIMVGEMRDFETAEIAIKAAQTGHLVLSTLHTNSAAESIHRLLNMGIPAYQIVNCFHLIIAQRLARKLCQHCRILQENNLTELPFTTHYTANKKGCHQCHQGYQGRTAIYEMIQFTPTVKNMLLATQSLTALTNNPQFISLRSSGYQKITAGITSLEELYRITIHNET